VERAKSYEEAVRTIELKIERESGLNRILALRSFEVDSSWFIAN
jgi:hypothetical protein